MPSGNGRSARVIAFCALMAALGTVMMMLGGLIPVMTYCSPLLASVLLIAVAFEAGNGSGWCVWAVTALLSLIIGVDKEAGMFYCFFGFYPLVKPYFDRIRPKAVCLVVKAAFFASLVALMYWLLCFVIGMDEVIESFSALMWVNVLTLAALVLVLLMFDMAYERLNMLYLVRLRPKLGINRK